MYDKRFMNWEDYIDGFGWEVNESYRKLLAEFDRLEKIKSDFEYKIQSEFEELGRPHNNDWWHLEEDPDESNFISHVEGAVSYGGSWKPFSGRLRTNRLTEYLEDSYFDIIDDFKNEEIF